MRTIQTLPPFTNAHRMLKLEDIYEVEVVVAKDGKEAYDIVKESMDKGELFNLIFMDIQVS